MEKQFKIVNVTISAVTDENEEVCIIENADVEQLEDCLYGAYKFIEFIEDNVYLENSISTSVYFKNSLQGCTKEWDGYWFYSEYEYIEVYFRSVYIEEKEMHWVGSDEIETYTEEHIELEITLHPKKY